jgi:tRNA pseudouridine55 synthase
MNGLLPIYKPSGITSYDVIRQIKRIIPRGTKIGHAGTLDPFAEGVLILMLGKATKRFDEIQSWSKTYRSVARLGGKSDTLDRTGSISGSVDSVDSVGKEGVQTAADKYIGEIEQVVPAYAAAKYKGRKLYEYAREGIVIPEKKKLVTVYSIEVLDVSGKEIEMRVECSSGTYIRQLSNDITRKLGIESYLTNLVRESIGEITMENCTAMNELESSDWQNKLISQ